MIEEASFGDVVLCRGQKFFEPAQFEADTRDEINTALLSGFGAEMMFARSVLFVEGEGDRQFFERLRRRFSELDPEGEVDLCFVVPVGGKARFAPWMRLLEAYGTAADRPIRWLGLADGDASREVRTAFRHAEITVRKEVLDALGGVTGAKNAGDLEAWRASIRTLNDVALESEIQMHLVGTDLEEVALWDASAKTIGIVAQAAGLDHDIDCDTLLAALGAKAFSNGKGEKGPWIRGLVGEEVPPEEESGDIRKVLERWFSAAMSPKKIESLFDRWIEDHSA